MPILDEAIEIGNNFSLQIKSREGKSLNPVEVFIADKKILDSLINRKTKITKDKHR
jgi:hypothetical protein